jgi:hypothetical protein
MQKADDSDSFRSRPVKHNMLSMLETAKPSTNLITGSPQAWRSHKHAETFTQTRSVTRRLIPAPTIRGVPYYSPNI